MVYHFSPTFSRRQWIMASELDDIPVLYRRLAYCHSEKTIFNQPHNILDQAKEFYLPDLVW
jgi:hypothetical protein